MTSTFWRESTGRMWEHLEDLRRDARASGSYNWRKWEGPPPGLTSPVHGDGIPVGALDACIVIGRDRTEIGDDVRALPDFHPMYWYSWRCTQFDTDT